MMRRATNPLLAGTAPLFVALVSCVTSAAEGDILPPAPNIFVQVGERYLTTHEIRQEVLAALRPQLVRRKQMMEAGAWTEAEGARLAAQSDALKREIPILLRQKAVMEEYARAQGVRPNEPGIEERLRRAARQAGGIEALVKSQGKTLSEIRDEFRGEELRARFMRQFVPEAAPPSPREIREYYAAHRDEIKAPARVKVRVLLVARGDDAEAALAEAEGLKRELQFAPDRFERLVREQSQHAETAARGGLITVEVDGEEKEWIGIDVLLRQNAAVARVVSRLSPGQVSDVLTFANGYALVKLDGLREGGPMGIGEAAEPIRRKLTIEKRERLLMDWVVYYSRTMYLADGLGRRIGAEATGPR